jgi:hypothetical protein
MFFCYCLFFWSLGHINPYNELVLKKACERGTRHAPYAPSAALLPIEKYIYRNASPVNGKRAICRARLIAFASWRWCFAQVPV